MSHASPVVLTARSLSFVRGGSTILSQVDLTVTTDMTVAVVGPNGVGKSTLLALLAGELAPTAGEVTRNPPDARIGIVSQMPERSSRSVRDFLSERAGVADAESALQQATSALARDGEIDPDRYDRALSAWLAAGVPDFESRAESVLSELGVGPELLDQPTETLSGGQAARVGLAAVVLSRFDITILDEPTNDLDEDGLQILEAWADDRGGGLVIVSHDRAFLERTATSVAEIDEHHHTVRVINGGWEAYVDERAAAHRRAVLDYEAYIDERDRLRARAQQQREWVQRGASRARKRPVDHDKNVRNFKIAQTEKLAAKAASTARAAASLPSVEKPWEGWDLRFSVADAGRSGEIVAVLREAVIERGDFVLGPVSLEVRWGDRLLLLGPNGAGKSTLIDAMLGRIPLVSGAAWLGSGVEVGELDQGRAALDDPDAALLTVFEDRSGLVAADARSVLAKFGLGADEVARRADALSPGERTRAQLALFQARGVNLLVLDEPTNHLDLPAIEQLEHALDSYGGTLIVVSHDRRFRETLATTDAVDVTRWAPVTNR